MPAERYYLSQKLIKGSQVRIEENEFHHLTHVMRAQPGTRVELVNGMGALAEGVVVAVEKKSALVSIESLEEKPKPTVAVILTQGTPRLNRLDFIIEKGTELGMTALWLFPADRSERKELSAHQVERCKAIAVSAMKQSGRLYLPEIILRQPLAKWEKPKGSLFFGDVSPDAVPFKKFWNEAPVEQTLFFIGPESGFSPKEEEILRAWKTHGVRLHKNILRTDTAALAALTLVSHWLDEGL